MKLLLDYFSQGLMLTWRTHFQPIADAASIAVVFVQAFLFELALYTHYSLVNA